MSILQNVHCTKPFTIFVGIKLMLACHDNLVETQIYLKNKEKYINKQKYIVCIDYLATISSLLWLDSGEPKQ